MAVSLSEPCDVIRVGNDNIYFAGNITLIFIVAFSIINSVYQHDQHRPIKPIEVSYNVNTVAVT